VQSRARTWKDRLAESLNSRIGLTLLFLGPIHFLLFFILLFPFLLEIYISFTSWEPLQGDWWLSTFNYGMNYFTLPQDKRFLWSLARTLLITVATVGAEFSIGLFLAQIFVRDFKAKKLFTSIYLTPMFIMPVIVGYNFYMLFQVDSGPINGILSFIAGSRVGIRWLDDVYLAVLSVIITDIWHWTPFLFLILLCGLLALPKDPIEAAEVLGASSFQVFKDIKLPMLKNLIIIAVAIRALEVMKLFDEIYIMTGGGPGFSTETISLYTYVQSITKVRMAYGTSAAIYILFLTLLAFSYFLRPIISERWRAKT